MLNSTTQKKNMKVTVGIYELMFYCRRYMYNHLCINVTSIIDIRFPYCLAH